MLWACLCVKFHLVLLSIHTNSEMLGRVHKQDLGHVLPLMYFSQDISAEIHLKVTAIFQFTDAGFPRQFIAHLWSTRG